MPSAPSPARLRRESAYPELVAVHGIDFVVAESGVRYLAPYVVPSASNDA